MATIASFIDATLLNHFAGQSEIEDLCQRAEQSECAAICVYPRWLPIIREFNPLSCVVISFPHGADLPGAKAAAAYVAVEEGAQEIDVVMDLAALRANDFATALTDLAAVVDVIAPVPVKAILETGVLDVTQLEEAAKVVEASGAYFAKTSTGFGPRGVSMEDVVALKRILSGDVQIKASGGIRDGLQARDLLRAGATRLGVGTEGLDALIGSFVPEPRVTPAAPEVDETLVARPAPPTHPESLPPEVGDPFGLSTPAPERPAVYEDVDEDDDEEPYQGPSIG